MVDPADEPDPRSPEACPICRRGEPLDIVGEGAVAWYTAASPGPMVGYVCVVAKRHVVEPFELQDGQRAAFWDDTHRAAKVVGGPIDPRHGDAAWPEGALERLRMALTETESTGGGRLRFTSHRG